MGRSNVIAHCVVHVPLMFEMFPGMFPKISRDFPAYVSQDFLARFPGFPGMFPGISQHVSRDFSGMFPGIFLACFPGFLVMFLGISCDDSRESLGCFPGFPVMIPGIFLGYSWLSPGISWDFLGCSWLFPRISWETHTRFPGNNS